MADSADSIAQRWLDRVLSDYQPQSSAFLGRETDRFRNPVGVTLREALSVLARELMSDMDGDRVSAALRSVLEIRAVESAPPSHALAFIFRLRDIVREQEPSLPLEVVLSRIDNMALRAVDIYMSIREKTYEIRVNEMRRRISTLQRVFCGVEF